MFTGRQWNKSWVLESSLVYDFQKTELLQFLLVKLRGRQGSCLQREIPLLRSADFLSSWSPIIFRDSFPSILGISDSKESRTSSLHWGGNLRNLFRKSLQAECPFENTKWDFLGFFLREISERSIQNFFSACVSLRYQLVSLVSVRSWKIVNLPPFVGVGRIRKIQSVQNRFRSRPTTWELSSLLSVCVYVRLCVCVCVRVSVFSPKFC